jgi:hypothetical protein
MINNYEYGLISLCYDYSNVIPLCNFLYSSFTFVFRIFSVEEFSSSTRFNLTFAIAC